MFRLFGGRTTSTTTKTNTSNVNNDDDGNDQQSQPPVAGSSSLPPIDTGAIQNQPSTSSNGSSDSAGGGVPTNSASASDPSPKSASAAQGGPASSSSPSSQHRHNPSSSPSPLHDRGDSANTSGARPASASPPPPSSFQPNWRAEAAPSRLSYKSFGQSSLGRTSEGYPSWLPRRPPPPAPASTIGTNTPMPPDLGEFGEFEREYREYLRQVQMQGSAAELQNDPAMDVSGAVDRETDVEPEADIDYLRGGVEMMERRDSTSPESPLDAIPPAQLGGRKATPRSVRIVNLQSENVAQGLGVGVPPMSKREPTDTTRVASGATDPLNLPLGYSHARTHSQSNWYSKKKSAHQKRISSGSTAVNQHLTRGHYRATAPPTTFHSIATTGGWSGAHPHDPVRSGERRTRPKFNIRGLHLNMLRSPSMWMKVYFRLWPILVLGHLPLQAFLDFNAVYMILQVSRYPLPTASPNSGKNWALCAAAYIACWLVSVLVIFVVYELVYSFARKWRVRRPVIFPLYLSAPGYNFACMTSYNVFCFFQHLRYTAFVPIEPDVDTVSSTDSDESQPGQDAHELEEKGEIVQEPRTPPATHTRQRHNEHFRTDSTSSNGSLDAKESDPALGRYKHSRSRSSKSKGPLKTLEKKVNKTKRLLRDRITWRDGLAETFNLYAQNLPNVLVLLPRAGLALGLILAFNPVWTDGSTGSIGSAINRDATFFRRDNGLLTSYALGVLWANVAWTAWRVLVLLGSWIGLWVLSGHGCAGICGPRDKWEEEEHNRLSAAFSATSSLASNDDSVLPWEWRECTRARVQDAWEFCLVGVGSGRYKWGADLYNAATGAQAFEKSGRVDEKRRAGGDDEEGGLSDEGLQRVLAAVGFPSVPTPAKRGVLSQDLFESPSKNRGASSDLERAEMIGEQRDLQRSGSGPLLKLPYPFTQPGSGQVSSNDLVPFPKEKDRESGKSKSSKTKSGSKKSRSGNGSGSSGSGSGSTSGSGNEGGLEGEGHEDEEEDDEDEDSSSHRYSEEPSTESSMGGRASNSMSSLGHPIPPTLGLTSVARSMSTYSPSPRQQRPGQASPHSGSSSSPLSWRSDVGNGGNTRFPFLSGPPVPSYIHRHRGVAVHTTGSSTGHSRGLSQVSGISGLSALSAGSGYAASGSAGAGMSEEGALSEMGEIIRENRQRDRNSSGESGGSAGSSGSGGLPMPPRHPLVGQEGRTRRRSTVQSSASGSSSASAPSPLSSNNSSSRAVATAAVAERQSEGVAFPSVSEREGRDRRRRRIEHTFGGTTPPNAEDLELGLGALSHESAMRAIRGRSRRLGEDDGESLQLSLRDDEHEHAARRERDEEDVYEDEDEESEVEGEREDVVGLLGSGSGNNSRGPSPRASLIGIQQGQGSDTNVAGSRSRTRSRHSSSAKSRESLRHSGAGRPLSLSLVSGGERSRHSSFHRQGYSVAPDSPVRARSRRESVASAVRERAGSFSVRIRQRAHSLMQSIAGGIATSPSSSVPASPLRGGEGSTSMTNLHAGGGHRRLGSSSGESALENFVTGTASARMPEVVRLPSQATPEAAAPAMRTVSGQSGASQETGESSGSGSGSSGVHPRHQQLIEEGYYSSSGHSRSGSESLSHGSAAEANYTFGRPVPFLQPRSQDQLSTHEEDPSAQPRSAPALVGTSEDDEEDDDEDQQFFSQEPSLRSPTLPARSRAGSATPSVLSDASGMITPMPHQMTFEAQQAHPALDDSPREVFLHPPASAWERHRSLAPGGASSDYLSVNTREGVESVMMLSSAAQSFVTAPVSIAESGTTTTTGRSGSSNDTNTISGSWEERRGFAGLFRGRPALLPQRGRRDSGMVERAGDVVGAGGGIGDGRIA